MFALNVELAKRHEQKFEMMPVCKCVPEMSLMGYEN